MEYKMKSIKYKLYLIVLLFVFINNSAVSQPAGNSVLTNAQVMKLNGCTRLIISFSFPVQYLTHVPTIKGNELRVQISPVAVSSADKIAANSDESIQLLDDTDVGIKYISYDGEFSLNRPFIVVTFENEVYFKVESGKDFRSLVIDIANKKFDSCK